MLAGVQWGGVARSSAKGYMHLLLLLVLTYGGGWCGTCHDAILGNHTWSRVADVTLTTSIILCSININLHFLSALSTLWINIMLPLKPLQNKVLSIMGVCLNGGSTSSSTEG